MGEIVIAIHNEGPAIAPADRERVFERFYRAVESRHRSAGTGLGLPITHLRLLRAVWGPEYGGELEYLRTFIRQLRRKLEDDPTEPAYLLTDSHIGYRFAEAKSDAVLERASK